MSVIVIVGLVAGAAGLALGYWLRGLRGPAGQNSGELRRQLAELQAQSASTQTRVEQLIAEKASAVADLNGAKNLLAERQAFHEKSLQDARIANEKSLAELKSAFKALSAEALSQSAPEFLRLAEAAFGKLKVAATGDLDQRKEAIAGLLKPLEEHLKMYQNRLQQSETAQSASLGELKRQLDALGQQNQALASETERFRSVLKSNQARGKWGEETLRRVVEAAGMSAHCDFTEQTQEDDKKPDMLVRLPSDRVVIVDAKVPDLEFISVLESADVEKRKGLLEAHATKLKTTIRDLGKKDYPAQFSGALDYVILFLPAESLFSAALEGDRDLITWAAGERIMLATPASLIAILRAISVSWRQFDQTENARAIAVEAEELYSRVATFIGHFEKIGTGLEGASKAYNDAVGSYERSVRPSGERVAKLGISTGKKVLAEIDTIPTQLRQLPAKAGADAG